MSFWQSDHWLNMKPMIQVISMMSWWRIFPCFGDCGPATRFFDSRRPLFAGEALLHYTFGASGGSVSSRNKAPYSWKTSARRNGDSNPETEHKSRRDISNINIWWHIWHCHADSNTLVIHSVSVGKHDISEVLGSWWMKTLLTPRNWRIPSLSNQQFFLVTGLTTLPNK